MGAGKAIAYTRADLRVPRLIVFAEHLNEAQPLCLQACDGSVGLNDVHMAFGARHRKVREERHLRHTDRHVGPRTLTEWGSHQASKPMLAPSPEAETCHKTRLPNQAGWQDAFAKCRTCAEEWVCQERKHTWRRGGVSSECWLPGGSASSASASSASSSSTSALSCCCVVPEGGSARVELLELGHSCADIRPLAAEDSCGMHGAVERTSAAPIIT